MTLDGNRRDVLRGRFARLPEAMHPPGAQPAFATLCTRCGDCLPACPEAILIQTDGGLPSVDFTRGECSFCGDCIAACPSDALLAEHLPDWPWRAVIQTACLSYQGIACRACEDACELRAIRFRLMTSGRAVPILDQSQCSGCGACAFTCPAQAVRFDRADPAVKESLT